MAGLQLEDPAAAARTAVQLIQVVLNLAGKMGGEEPKFQLKIFTFLLKLSS